MRHLTLDELLALDEPGVVPGSGRAREHLAACAACAAEQARLRQRQARLRALPTLRPARDQWPAVAARVAADRRRRRTVTIGGSVLALAASVALAVLVRREPVAPGADPAGVPEAVAAVPSQPVPVGPRRSPAPEAAPVAAAAPAAGAVRDADALAVERQLEAIQARSQALEAALDAYAPDARMTDGRTVRIATDLEDRIANVDRQLEAVELQVPARRPSPEALRLWKERVGLLDALVDVHVTRASHVGL